MPKFDAQHTDASNARPVPSVTNRGGVTLVSQKSAQAIAQEDNRDTARPDAAIERAEGDPLDKKVREGGQNPTASIKSKYAI